MNALCEAFPTPEGWARTACDAVLVGPEVERGDVRRPRHVGARRARDGVARPAGRRPGARAPSASRRKVGGCCCSPDRRRALDDEALPERLEAAALVVFDEQIRADAADTLGYFAEQGVACMVISGDNPRTVGAIAARVGIVGAEPAVDGRDLPDDLDELGAVLETTAVFGRVTPQQKRAIVGALQQRGHVVAMTGDGVNDALALKDADIGVAMGSGAPATRAVAQVVLLDGQFAAMPGVVAEGPARHRERRARREPVRHEDGVRDAARDRGRYRALAVPVPARVTSRSSAA